MAQNLVPAGGGSGGTLVITVNATQAISNLNILQAHIINTTRRSQQAMNGLTASFQSFTNMIKSALTALGGFLVLRQITRMVEGFISRMIEVNRTFTGFMASMTIIKGSAQAAAQEYQFLLAISNKIGVPLEKSIAQYHRLAAAMKNVDKNGELTRHIFAGVSEAAVVLQARGHDTTLIFEAIQQMASKGKLSLEELQRQLGNTLPGAISIAARAMMGSSSFMKKGIDTVSGAEKELRKQIKDGTINVYEFLARFSNQLKKEYGAGVKIVSDSFQANFARMQNAVFEFYRAVGSSSAMKGLTSIVRELAALFNDTSANSAAGLGQALGDAFERIAKWIASLDATDIQSFFAAISGAIQGVFPIMETFFDTFSFLGSSEMKTPVLDFVEFVMDAFAAMVDAINGTVRTVEVLLRSLVSVFGHTADVLMGNVDNLMAARQYLPGADPKAYAEYQGSRRAQKDWLAKNDARIDTQIDNSLLDPDAWGSVGPTTKKMDAIFGQLRAGILKSGSSKKAGSSADAMSQYFNPLGDSEFQKLLEGILANSGAPNGTGNGKPAKTTPSQKAYMSETTKLVKELAVAQNELDNVLQNKNLTEGKAEAQMRALLMTDERYLGMSESQKNALMATAKAIDAVNLKLENAIKLQKSNNETLMMEAEIRNKLNDLRSTGFESQYNKASEMQSSFMEGGDNQNVDPATKAAMLANATRQDNAQRLLDMERMTQQIKQQNEDLQFQSDLYGKSALETQKMTEYRKIDLDISKMMVGASEEMKQQYIELGEVLKNQVGEQLDRIHEKQKDMVSGADAGLTEYLDSISNYADFTKDMTVKSFSTMEDALVDFVTTGKLSFGDLAKSIIADLVRIMIRMTMVKALGGTMWGNGQGTTSSSGGWFSGLMSMIGLGGGPNAGAAAQGLGSSFGIPLPGSGGGNFFLSAKGNAFMNGRMINAYARGGILDRPTLFTTAGGGLNIGGEAGTEAILPLKRGPGGRLGVAAHGSGGSTTINMPITVKVKETTPKRTADQIASETGTRMRRVAVRDRR